MRDYTDKRDSTFWKASETYVGCSYGDATYAEGPHGDAGRFFAKVSYKDNVCVKYGDTLEEAQDALSTYVIAEQLSAAFKAFLSALPDSHATALLSACRSVLETQYAVFTARLGSTADDVANALKSSEYHERVRGEVDEIKDLIARGDITRDDDVYERIREIEVIYTGDALDILRASSNDQAYWEEMGGEAPSWSMLACFALQADVRDALGFDPSDIEEHVCARCGDVVTTEEGAEECPKCGLNFDVTEKEGIEQPDPNSAVEFDTRLVCEECTAGTELKGDAIPHDTEFTCSLCEREFITSQAPPAPKVEPPPVPPPPPPATRFTLDFDVRCTNGSIEIEADTEEEAREILQNMKRDALLQHTGDVEVDIK